MIILNLPFPISVNAMYANKGRSRTKSLRYRTWAVAAGWDVTRQKQKPIKGWYALTLILNEKDNRRRDPDNFVKSVSDLLTTHNLIEDDSKCSSITVERFKASRASCEVIVRPSNGIPARAA
ncbi:MAG: RusA family crossover junction endodeoxyribonuclease [Desulfobacteraceae bacterium]|nr:RusA family crossover junction endodeoxyribonuclease [Desulfobacteraceae bacterium]